MFTKCFQFQAEANQPELQGVQTHPCFNGADLLIYTWTSDHRIQLSYRVEGIHIICSFTGIRFGSNWRLRSHAVRQSQETSRETCHAKNVQDMFYTVRVAQGQGPPNVCPGPMVSNTTLKLLGPPSKRLVIAVDPTLFATYIYKTIVD